MAFVDVNKRKEGISFVYVILYVSRCMTACLIALEQDPAACVLTLCWCHILHRQCDGVVVSDVLPPPGGKCFRVRISFQTLWEKRERIA